MQIVATADLHGHLPEIPKCDLLIVGGDVAPDFGRPGATANNVRSQLAWCWNTFAPWLANVPADHIIGIGGNHDFGLEQCPEEARSLPWQYLLDEATEFRGLKIFGTPWVPNLSRWAFHKDDAALGRLYDHIPADVDILVTHGPPFGFCDHTVPKFGSVRAGSPDHTQYLARTQAKVNICGHIHEGYGFAYTARGTTVANVAHQTERYEPINPPVSFFYHDGEFIGFNARFPRTWKQPPQTLQAQYFYDD